MDCGAKMTQTSLMIFGDRHARNIAHSLRILVFRDFIQDGFRDLSGDHLGPHFGVVLGPQRLHYTIFLVTY